MNCARCGRVVGRGEYRHREDRIMCFKCWLDGWCFDGQGNIARRAVVVKPLAEIVEKNWQEFRGRNFGGDAA